MSEHQHAIGMLRDAALDEDGEVEMLRASKATDSTLINEAVELAAAFRSAADALETELPALKARVAQLEAARDGGCMTNESEHEYTRVISRLQTITSSRRAYGYEDWREYRAAANALKGLSALRAERDRLAAEVERLRTVPALVWVGSVCGVPSAMDLETADDYQIGDCEPCCLCAEDSCVAHVVDWNAHGDDIANRLAEKIEHLRGLVKAVQRAWDGSSRGFLLMENKLSLVNALDAIQDAESEP